MKLNQAIALINTVKQTAKEAKTGIYHIVQKPDLFQALSRTFLPREEEGYIYPPEDKFVQTSVPALLAAFAEACTDLFDLAAEQDWANTQAKASVVVDGVTILPEVPVTYLLFLEKQLEDIKTFVSKLPVLAADEVWRWDGQRECFATEPRYTTKKKSITVPVVLYEATEHHPAQVKEATREEPEGNWQTIKYSTAASQAQANELLRRVEKLHRAVLLAREEANAIETARQNVATPVFNYLFADLPR